jgi:hypothetical protein
MGVAATDRQTDRLRQADGRTDGRTGRRCRAYWWAFEWEDFLGWWLAALWQVREAFELERA